MVLTHQGYLLEPNMVSSSTNPRDSALEPTVHPDLGLLVEGQRSGPQLVIGLLAGHQRLQQGERAKVLLQKTLLLVDVLRRPESYLLKIL